MVAQVDPYTRPPRQPGPDQPMRVGMFLPTSAGMRHILPQQEFGLSSSLFLSTTMSVVYESVVYLLVLCTLLQLRPVNPPADAARYVRCQTCFDDSAD